VFAPMLTLQAPSMHCIYDENGNVEMDVAELTYATLISPRINQRKQPLLTLKVRSGERLYYKVDIPFENGSRLAISVTTIGIEKVVRGGNGNILEHKNTKLGNAVLTFEMAAIH